MAFWREVKEIFREEMSLAELTDPSRAGARLRNYVLLLRETVRSIRQDKAMTMASALAFKSLLALVPVLAISLSIVAMMNPSETGTDAVYTNNFFSVIQDRIPQFAGRQELLDSVKGFAANAGAIAGVGFIFLFGTAFSLLMSIEDSFNLIWQVRERRAFLARVSAFLATMIIVPMFMSLSVYVTSGAAQFADRVAANVEELQQTIAPGEKPEQSAQPETEANAQVRPQSVFRKIVLALMSLVTICLAMAALFYLMPNTPVSLRAALVGGFFAGASFEAALYLFHFYAAHLVDNYTRIYGPLLALPLFLLWVWLVWVMVLFGAEVAFTVQNFRNLAARAELEKRGISTRLYLAARIVAKASALFHRGEDPGRLVERITEELKIPQYMVREMVSLLARENILCAIEDREGAYLPAKDIACLTLADVVRSVSADTLDVPETPDDPLRRHLAGIFRQAEKGSIGLLAQTRLSELAELDNHPVPEPAAPDIVSSPPVGGEG
jgi:membrane protein